MGPDISGKLMALLSKLQFQFAMYNPINYFVEVNVNLGSVLYIRCNEFNATVTFNNPDDIVYLYRLAEEQPLTYVKSALAEDGLQGYVDAMNWFNY